MPLSAGDKLGPYEILDLIGKGGMGEVYRAHDPRLRRDVAIKISAERFNERFEREAAPSPLSIIRTSARSTTSARTTW